MKKKILLYSLIIILIIGILYFFIKNIKEMNYSQNSNQIVEEFDIIYEDGVKINTSKALHLPKQIEDLNIINISLSCKNGLSTLLADVVNTGSSKIDNLNLKVEILDKNENIIMELTNKIFSLEAGNSKELNINVSADIADAYDFRISKI